MATGSIFHTDDLVQLGTRDKTALEPLREMTRKNYKMILEKIFKSSARAFKLMRQMRKLLKVKGKLKSHAATSLT
jgi:hypothetical protein